MYAELYFSKSNWQKFDDPYVCSIIGQCFPDEHVTKAVCVQDDSTKKCQLDFETNKISEEIYGCAEDMDCAKVDASCCGCNNGGAATSVAKSYARSWDSNLSEQCKGVVCPKVLSDHWTCSASPACIGNVCSLIAQNV